MKKKHLSGLILALVLVLWTAASKTYAQEDMWVNPNTGMTESDAAAAVSTESEHVINSTTKYDVATRQYIISVDNANYTVRASVASGMYTRDRVSIAVPDGILSTLYRNGNQVDSPDLHDIADPGSYVLQISDGTMTSEPLRFTILAEETSAVTGYELPTGFEVVWVSRDEDTVTVDGNYISLMDEGEYVISYKAVNSDLSYTLITKIDRTAPEISIYGVNDYIAKGPVRISDVPEDATLTVYLNGEAINEKEELTQAGEYVLKVSDRAGNENVYEFRMLTYLDSNAKLFIAIIVLGAAGLFIYLRIDRKKMRVR